MDERTALAVAAVRAVETADRARATWTDADRAWASRAAAETVGETAPAPAFIGRRALLAFERMRERKHAVARFAQGWQWRPWVGAAVVLAAFALGTAANSIGVAHRINILYSPVAPLVLWNVAVFLVLGAGFVLRYGDAGTPGPLTRLVARLAGGLRAAGRRGDAVTTRAVADFTQDWAARATPVYAARAARVLHLAAAALALGVIVGLYVRGLGLEYRATWESTFLDPPAVHAVVAVFYAPGSWVTRLPVPDAAHIAAIRAPASENAAIWLHLMAATLAVVVVLPRLVLAAGMSLIERHRAAHLYDDLRDPYFHRLLRGFHEGPLTVDVVPYSFAPAADATQALQSLLARALGGNVTLEVAVPVAYGDEDTTLGLAPEPAHAPVVALFNAAATPEHGAHGRFVSALAQTGRPVVIVVDEAAQNARWPDDEPRRNARRALWREFAADARRTPVFVDLARPELELAEAAFDAALDDETR